MRSSWGCCGYPNGVCCSDEKNCCPNGYVCDISRGDCYKGNSRFLNLMVSNPYIKSLPLNSTDNTETIWDFLLGFREGTNLTDYLPDLTGCGVYSEKIYEFSQKAIQIFKSNLTVVELAAEGVRNIGFAIENIGIASESCVQIPQKSRLMIDYLVRVFKNFNAYLSAIGSNIFYNSYIILSEMYGIQDYFNKGQLREAGVHIGRAFTLIFYVNLPTSQNNFLSLP